MGNPVGEPKKPERGSGMIGKRTERLLLNSRIRSRASERSEPGVSMTRKRLVLHFILLGDVSFLISCHYENF